MALHGLTTQASPKIPSKPIDRSALNKILVNPYYKGFIQFHGVLYPGKHIPLTDEKTWQHVQDILDSHLNGERTRDHPHFLKSTVYCGNCGSRLLVNLTKSHLGAIYPYFICSGRHDKRASCLQKAVLIEEVEYQIEKLYERISISPELREHLETWLNQYIKESADEFEVERANLERERNKLEHKRKKLLQAHYEDAIPLDLFKSEQEKISKALLDIDDQIAAHSTHYEIIKDNLKQTFDLIVDCGQAYKQAPDMIKRAFNQAIFEKILVYPDGTIVPEFAEPFDILLDLINSGFDYSQSTQMSEIMKNSNCSEQLTNPVQYFFGQGLSKRLLVGAEGLEPPTPSV